MENSTALSKNKNTLFDKVITPKLDQPNSTSYRAFSFTLATIVCSCAFLSMPQRGAKFVEQLKNSLPEVYNAFVNLFGSEAAADTFLKVSAENGPYWSNFALSHTMVNLNFMPNVAKWYQQLTDPKLANTEKAKQAASLLCYLLLLAFAASGEGKIIANDLINNPDNHYTKAMIGWIAAAYGFTQGNESAEGLIELGSIILSGRSSLLRLKYARQKPKAEILVTRHRLHFYLACLSQFSYAQAKVLTQELFGNEIDNIDNRDRDIANAIHLFDQVITYILTGQWQDEPGNTYFKTKPFDNKKQAQQLLEKHMPSVPELLEKVILTRKALPAAWQFEPKHTGNTHPSTMWVPTMAKSLPMWQQVLIGILYLPFAIFNAFWRELKLLQLIGIAGLWFLFSSAMIPYGVLTYINPETNQLDTNLGFYVTMTTIFFVMMLATRGMYHAFSTKKYSRLSTEEWLYPMVSLMAQVFIVAFFLTGPLFQVSMSIETAENIDSLPLWLQNLLNIFWLGPSDEDRIFRAGLFAWLSTAAYNKCFVDETVIGILVGFREKAATLSNYVLPWDMLPPKEHLAFAAYVDFIRRSTDGFEKFTKTNTIHTVDELENAMLAALNKQKPGSDEEEAPLVEPDKDMSKVKQAMEAFSGNAPPEKHDCLSFVTNPLGFLYQSCLTSITCCNKSTPRTERISLNNF